MESRVPLHRKKKGNPLVRAAREKLSLYNFLYNMARRLYRLCMYLKWKLICELRKLRNNFNFDLIYFINTDEILLCTEKEYDPFIYDGVRLDGEWDISTKEFRNLDVFIAFTDHYVNNVEWEYTEYYRNILGRIHNGYAPWRCASEKDLKLRFSQMDKLFMQIKLEGYRTQAELSPSRYDIKKIDEISVNLDRDGNLLFNNGVHRLSIAKILKIAAIPVRVTVCHAKCRNFEKLHKFEDN